MTHAEIARKVKEIDQEIQTAIGEETPEEKTALWSRPFPMTEGEVTVTLRRCNRCRESFYASWYYAHDAEKCQPLSDRARTARVIAECERLSA